jgi:hypothetical protein
MIPAHGICACDPAGRGLRIADFKFLSLHGSPVQGCGFEP